MKLLADFFSVVGIVINVLILFLLFKKECKKLSQKLLIIVFFCTLFSLLAYYAFINDILWLLSIAIFPTYIMNWCLGPILLLYVKSLFLKPKGLVKKHFLHFLPALLMVLYFVYVLMLFLIFREQSLEKEGMLQFLELLYKYQVVWEDLYLLVYCIVTLRLLIKYRKMVKATFSSLSYYDFLWIQHMLLGIITILGVDILISCYYIYVDGGSVSSHGITVFTITFLVIYLGYYGLNQSQMLLPRFILNNARNNTVMKPSVVKYLKEEEVEMIQMRFRRAMEDERPYLDEELTLGKLAKILAVKDKKLSAFLNEYMNTTFYDFINKKRVEEVQKKMKLEDFKNYTLMGIANESGFKSKASFNRIFKKETGLSPSEFKKVIGYDI